MEFQIGGRLKERRKSKGLSITDLAEQSGVSTGPGTGRGHQLFL